MKETDIFRAELTCRDAAVEKMNLHLSVATFDAEGAVPAVAGMVYKAAATEPAAAASVSFYAVPADGPASDLVSEWPAFKLELSVWKNDTLIDRRTFRVNRWGGTQMIGLRYEETDHRRFPKTRALRRHPRMKQMRGAAPGRLRQDRNTDAGQLFGPTFRPHRTAAARKSSGRTHPVRPISGAGSAYDGNRTETDRPKFVRHS